MLCRIFCLVLLSLSIGSTALAKDIWVRVSSPHFSVYSNGSEKQARRTARQFEQMRLVFEKGFPRLRLDSGSPIYVIAARDERSMKQLLPEFWERRGRAKPAGVFMQFWEKNFAVVRLDADGEDSYHTVYHEYVHYLLSLNFRRLPIWLNEGIAEFYGNAELREKEARVALPSTMLGYLRPTSWIPLEKIISVTPSSPYYTEESRAGLFYAEAWLLTHYLIFGKKMNSGALLNEFAKLLQEGVDEGEAFRKVFGDPKKMDKEVSAYATQKGFMALTAKTDLTIKEDEFPVVSLNDAQWAAFAGGFELCLGRLKRARPLLEQALAENAGSPIANENMGFLLFHEGKDEEAAKFFGKAAEQDPKAYLPLYYYTMLTVGAAKSASERQRLDSQLGQVLELNPQFAPAFVALSISQVRQGNLDRARGLAVRATQLEPNRAGYVLNVARILARMGNLQEAEQAARRVADRWEGPDQEEAQDLLAEIAAKSGSRDSGRVATVSLEPGTKESGHKTARGTIEAISCSDKVTEVVLRVGEQKMKFRPGPRMIVGIPDTIWYGADHFDPCHHLEGAPAVVHYKESSEPLTGEIATLSVRDPFPEAAAPKTEATPSTSR